MPDLSAQTPVGPGKQIIFLPADVAIPANTPLLANQTINGSLQPTLGAKRLAVSGTASVTAKLFIYGYLDTNGQVLAFTASVPLAAGVAGMCIAPDGIPYQSWKCAIQNLTGNAGNCVANQAVSQN